VAELVAIGARGVAAGRAGEEALQERRLRQPRDHGEREDEEREILSRRELEGEGGGRCGGPDQEEAAEDAAPEREAQVPSQPARPDSPLRAIGKPSKVVAMAEGVPGIAGSASRRR
jgi:hypothetical protein